METISHFARRLANQLRTHYLGTPPPSGVATGEDLTQLLLTWRCLHENVVRWWADGGARRSATLEQRSAMNRLLTHSVEVADQLGFGDLVLADVRRKANPNPNPDDESVVRSIEWAAGVLDGKSPDMGDTPPKKTRGQGDDDFPLGLHVDHEKRTVRRDGYNVVFDLSARPGLWHIFRVALAAYPEQMTLEAMHKDYPGKWNDRARNTAKGNLNKMLLDIGLEIANRTLTDM